MYYIANFEKKDNKGYEKSAYIGGGVGLVGSGALGYGAYRGTGSAVDYLQKSSNKGFEKANKSVDNVFNELSEKLNNENLTKKYSNTDISQRISDVIEESKDTKKIPEIEKNRFNIPDFKSVENNINANVEQRSRNAILDLYDEKIQEAVKKGTAGGRLIRKKMPKYKTDVKTKINDKQKFVNNILGNKKKFQKITGLGIAGASSIPLVGGGALIGMGMNYYRNKFDKGK